MKTGLLEARGLAKTFGRGNRATRALKPLDLGVGAGEIIGLVGPNGAGKTTLMKILAGQWLPSSGSVTIQQGPRSRGRGFQAVGFVPDPPILPREFTAKEWLGYLSSHRAKGPKARMTLLREALEVGSVQQFANKRIGDMSRGMVNQVALAGASMVGDQLVILDETLANIDPIVARSLRETINALARGGRAVVISSHDLGVLEKVATRVIVLGGGELLADVSMAQLLADRVAEIDVEGKSLGSVRKLTHVFSRARLTGAGISIPLEGGLSVENVLSVCRDNRIAVSRSRVRYKAIEDLLLESVSMRSGY